MIKKSSRLIITIAIAGLVLLSPIQGNAMVANEVDIITKELNHNDTSPYAENTGWRYKFENGKMYKRLYNYDTGKWIGDWILVN
jgi:hypothetical protein